MSFLEDIFRNTLQENERNLHFWEDYLQKLKTLNFDDYVDKLTVPILVPIGSRIFFRGELKHTNEVTVSLGADYFAKCSLKQAETLKQHRIKDAQSKVDVYRKEQEYLKNQFNFTKQNIYENQGQEIVEVYTEEEDKLWRVKHRENMRIFKQKQKKEENAEQITDEELRERLEELELQEELENELLEVNPELCYNSEKNEQPFEIKEDEITKTLEHKSGPNTEKNIEILQKKKNKAINEENKKEKLMEVSFPEQLSKFDLLQQVINRQNDLQNKLSELKNREKNKSKTEEDLLMKLDEMEQLDELEDEMDRLDDILDKEEIIEQDEEVHENKLQRGVSFADEYDSETLEIIFTHSDVEPKNEMYDPEKGIQKPSDIYQAFSSIINEEPISILKKSKYELDRKEAKEEVKLPESKALIANEEIERQTIVIQDVIEKAELKENKLEDDGRPMSLFKKKRLQNKY